VAKVGTSNPDHTISLKRVQCIVEKKNNTLGKMLPVPTEEETGWIPEPFCTLWRIETILPLPEMEAQFLSCLAHSLVALLTPNLVPL